MTTIGLTGFARAGKDTVGKILCDHHGFTRVAFADRLKQLAIDLDPILPVSHNGETYNAHLSEAVACSGSLDAAKVEYPEVRAYLQTLGVAVRNRLGEDAWINAALGSRSTSERIVVTDCRFPNEAKAIRSHGGRVLRVLRPGVSAANGHVSERPLPDNLIDGEIFNAGSLTDLEVGVDRVLAYLNFPRRHIQGVVA